MEIINSRKNPKILHLISLRAIKNIKKENLFVDEGLKNLLMALKSNLVVAIFTTKDFSIDNKDINIYKINEDVYKKISLLKNGDGYVFIAKNMIKDDKKIYDKSIYLDDIQDPGNVGTIIRTALAFSYKQIILSNKCASIFNFKTLSACKGAQYNIDIKIYDFEDVLKLKNDNQDVIATTLSKTSIPLEVFPKLDNFILVFGNEGSGVNPNIINKANYQLNIPINNIDSLNVSVAAAIIMYHFQ